MNYTNHHILEFLEEWAPESTKLEYDNVGLLVGDHDRKVGKVITCLDVTPDVVDEAIAEKADLIVAHHPLIFKKLSRVTSSDPVGSLLFRLIKNDIGLIAAHTNLDAAPGGVSFVLAERLGLKNVQFLKEAQPDGNSEEEHRTNGFGVSGWLPEPMSTPDFLALVHKELECRCIRYSGFPKTVQKVSVCGGAGSFLIEDALNQKMDAYITADLKYHEFFTGCPSFLLVDAGHYESEIPVTGTLCDRLSDRFPELEVLCTNVNTNPVAYFFNEET